MKSLFIRIFLWFWVSMTVVIVAFVITVILTMPKPPEHPKLIEHMLDALSRSIIFVEQKGGMEQVKVLCKSTTDEQLFHIRLLDESNKDLSTSEVVDFTEEQLQQIKTDGSGFFHIDDKRVIVKVITTNSGRHLTLVYEEEGHKPDFFDDFLETGAMLLRGLIVVLIVGLVCFWLARSIAKPMSQIRLASSRVAAGDFDVRLGPDVINRGDEFADVGRIFNTMTEQVGKIITAQHRMFQDASHELRSPLARMNLAISLARRDPPEKTTIALDRIEREIQRIDTIVNSMLTLTRLDSGVEPATQPVDCASLLERIIEDAAFEASSRNIQIVINAEYRPKIEGHVDLLYIAFENIIRNSLRYTRTGESVDITLRALEGNRAVIVFCDHGLGVPDSEIKKLAEPFYTLPGDDKSGAGLGLSIVDRIVKKHNGTLEFRNADGEDSGLIATMILPAIG